MKDDLEPDVLVVGGGPAGSSVATLVKKYRPEASVVVCEKTAFPRHHIGESLVADVNRLLADLGAYDKVAAAGFVPKYGSTFIWGRDRKPWSIEFARLGMIPGFAGGSGYQTDYTWHVRRPEYDKLLLDHAQEMGANVLMSTAATIAFGDDQSVTEVALSDGRTMRPRFVVDATGQHNQIARRMRTLTYDPELRNIAIYGYYENAKLDPVLMGTWEESRIGIISVAEGWFWYIPLAQGLVSVGLVTNQEALRKRGDKSVEAILDSAIDGCDEIRPLLADARRVRFGGAESDVLTIRDYCYTVSRLHGPGWSVVGDAAGFVDPILSIGAYLAHTAASRLAYTLNTLLGDSNANAALLWRAYEEQIQFSLSAFRRMTYMFYGYNDSKESWWWEAKQILRNRALPPSLDEKSAFLALATGYGINRPVYHEAICDFGVNIFDSFYQHLVRPESLQNSTPLGHDKVWKKLVALEAEPWMVPVEGTGKMQPVHRVTFTSQTPDGEVPPRLLLPDAFWRFLENLDGRRASQVLGEMAAEDAAAVKSRLGSFLMGLSNMGILAQS